MKHAVREEDKMKIITICGSLRFKKEMMEIAEKMELLGNCVITPIYPTNSNKDAYTKDQVEVLDQMHKEKIKIADTIIVINVNHYIGNSTRSEIEFAQTLNKEIIYYTDIVNSMEHSLKNKRKVVIAGSASLQKEVNNWSKYFEDKNYEVLDYPKEIDESKFMELYSNVHTEFLENITKTDMVFVMNEDKNGVVGYIGYEAYAELLFGLAQKLIYNKEIELVILKMPSRNVGCYEEISLWLKLGWIRLYEVEK